MKPFSVARLILLHENTIFTSHMVIKKQFLIVAPRPEVQLLQVAVTGFTRLHEDDCENSKLSVTNECTIQARTLLLATSIGLLPQLDPWEFRRHLRPRVR